MNREILVVLKVLLDSYFKTEKSQLLSMLIVVYCAENPNLYNYPQV
jgi:hypothetical protein